MLKDRLIIKKLLKEEVSSKNQQKLTGEALSRKNIGELAEIAHDDNESNTKNEIRNIVKEELLALLGENWSSTTDVYRAGRSAQGVSSASDVGFARDPLPVGRPRGYDKPFDRNPDLNYDRRMAPWKLDLMKTAVVEARKCGISEKEVGEVQNMLKSILEGYDDDDHQAASQGSKIIAMILNATCRS